VARLCSQTFSVGLKPETSMALTWAVGAFSALDVSAKESSRFHMHGSHFCVGCLVFPFLLTCSGRASMTATHVINKICCRRPRSRSNCYYC